jgi:hypothetical protein
MANNHQIGRFRKMALAIGTAIPLLTSSLPVGTISAANADVDAEYRDPNETREGYQIVILKDRIPLGDFSFLMAGGSGGWGQTCSSLNDPACASARGSLRYVALLPPCTVPNQLDCIAELGSVGADGTRSAGSFSRYFPTSGRHDFSGDPNLFLPTGAPPSMWTLPAIPHSGGSSYFVKVGVIGQERDSTNGGFKTTDFSIDITPAVIVPDPNVPIGGKPNGHGSEDDDRPGFYELPDGEPKKDENGDSLPISTHIGLAGYGGNDYFDCLLGAEAQCVKRESFPGDVTLFIRVRLSSSPKGWLHGRISEPNIAINSIAGTKSGIEISIQAKTVRVPVVSTSTAFADLPAPLQQAYSATGGFEGASAGTRRPSNNLALLSPEVRNAISSPASYSSVGMKELIAWLPYIKDTATANISKWTVRSLSESEMQSAGKCLTNNQQLNGLVMTNATQYSSGPPTFNSAEGSLNYQVAAPHYTSGGNVFLGTYDLVMRSEVARCIYGFSKAPLNASISVIDDGGVTTTATKLVSERDGWLRIAAYGFGFSNPMIKVKLTQSGSKGVVSKKTTILCKKGKTLKKVTGIAPKCPVGYKMV